MTEKDAATVLEDAADLLLVRGRCKGSAFDKDGRRCVIGAMANVSGWTEDGCRAREEAEAALQRWLKEHQVESARLVPGFDSFGPVRWNDNTDDDDEVRDTLLLVAKSLRNGETS